jgi:uncharacterized membrane protein (DUF4010 family)
MPTTEPWPYLPTFTRLALALALGLFVGLERERRGKEAGVRTFAFACLLGCLGGMLSDAYALLSIGFLALLVIFLNWHSLSRDHDTEMTTSAALLVTGFVGVLCGKGHTFTPVSISIVTAGLLAWKQRLSGFSTGLTEQELRSAILLGILGFVIYPVLPEPAIDPWGLVEPRSAWVTVILIAAIGFVNYILLKVYGSRGVGLTGFLGGLVNSTVAVTEMCARVRAEGLALHAVAYRGVMLAVAAMLLRNLVLLGLLAPRALLGAALPIGVMLLVALALAALGPAPGEEAGVEARGPQLKLQSPFSLKAALEFGLVFLLLHVAGTLAQRMLGQAGFYAVSLIGGFISSASAVASAGTLAGHGKLAVNVAAQGAALATMSSALISLPLVARIARRPELTRRVAAGLGMMVLLGMMALLLPALVPALRLR